MTHTPGPWKAVRKAGLTIYPEDSSVYVAFMNNALSNCEANANLMATAPEMLEALEDLLTEFTCWLASEVSTSKNPKPWLKNESWVKARQIVYKAKGEPNEISRSG